MCICSSYFINFCLAAHTLIKGYLKIWGVLNDRLLVLKNYLKVEQQILYTSKYILAIYEMICHRILYILLTFPTQMNYCRKSNDQESPSTTILSR